MLHRPQLALQPRHLLPCQLLHALKLTNDTEGRGGEGGGEWAEREYCIKALALPNDTERRWGNGGDWVEGWAEGSFIRATALLGQLLCEPRLTNGSAPRQRPKRKGGGLCEGGSYI